MVIENGQIIESHQTDSGYDPISQAKNLINNVAYDQIMATGYGRGLFEISFDSQTVTEIKAYARGVKELYPKARTILDIGGQDSKAISLFEQGKIKKFEMNDRCAAGTGKFLEIMAKALGFSIEEFGNKACKAAKDLQINSMCTVFAESEVTSLIARGEDRIAIAKGLHMSVARRAVNMLKRVSVNGDFVFAGGVAKNQCMRSLLEKALNKKIHVPDNPQMIGAFWAALLIGD